MTVFISTVFFYYSAEKHENCTCSMHKVIFSQIYAVIIFLTSI